MNLGFDRFRPGRVYACTHVPSVWSVWSVRSEPEPRNTRNTRNRIPWADHPPYALHAPDAPHARHAPYRAFTLIEMVGVLAVLAILASVLMPKLFEAIHSARIANASRSCDTVRIALVDHFNKYGSFLIGGSPPGPLTLNINNYDQVLLSEQFLDKTFAVKIGDGTTNTLVQALDITGSGYTLGAAVDGNSTSGFALAGGGTNTTIGMVLIEAVITGVSAADAKELSDRIDGESLSAPMNSADYDGRVKYGAPGANGTTTVYVYLTHR